jgi:hypothetical protein
MSSVWLPSTGGSSHFDLELIPREIKNTIRSAQALAVADGTELTMKHIKTVLDVQKEFREDFEGLPGIWNGMGVS